MSKDTKRMILAMTVALAFMFGWQYFLRWKYADYYKWKEEEARRLATQPAGGTQAPAPSTTTPSTGATQPTAITTQPGNVTTAPAAPGGWRARGADVPTTQPVALGSAKPDDPNYAMAVELVGRGAAVDSVVLNSFRQNAKDPVTRYKFQTPYENAADRERARSFLTRHVNVDGTDVDLSNVTWRLQSSDSTSATFAVDVLQGDRAIGRVEKVYRLSPRSSDANSPLGYQVNVVHRFVNLIDRPVTFKLVVNGPTAPPQELENQPDQNIVAGYWNEGAIATLFHNVASEFAKESWRDYTKHEKAYPLVWGGTQSAYFEALVRPVPEANLVTPQYVAKFAAEVVNPLETRSEKRQVMPYFETGAIVVDAGQTTAVDLEAYLGPKGRTTLNAPYYANPPRDYDQTLIVTGFWLCAMCTWQWLIDVLVVMLTFFQRRLTFGDWGLAIIILVFIVRALLHPITKKSQVYMMRMQKMAPELEKLKKKYGDNKEELARAQMQFYKEQGMTPILGCLPMFLQMPIWIALWNALQSTFELRHAPFLYGLTWIDDLSKPDYLIRFKNTYHFLFLTISGINLLPILLGIVFYLQTKYFTPKPPSMTPEQAQQQKIMTWMTTLMFPLMLYTGPSGLNLYIFASTLFGIIESKIIRDHIKQREALEAAAGPTIVDAPPPGKGGGGGGGGGRGGKEPPEAGGKKGWFQRLQEKAEEMRKEAERKAKKR